jgi:hypothetical protein
LGGFIGEDSARTEWISEKVEKWQEAVTDLTKVRHF